MINADNGPENNTGRTQWINAAGGVQRRASDHGDMAEGMTYKGVHPTATVIEAAYPKGVRLTKKQMQPYEARLQRLTGLRKWFATITTGAATPLCSSGSP